MLLGAESFDHLGSDTSLLLNGIFNAQTQITLSNANPRTGTRNLRLSNGLGLVRWTLSRTESELDECGFGYALNISELPSDSESMCLAALKDSDGNTLINISASSSGQVIAMRGGWSGVELGRSLPVLYTGSYQHFEFNAVIDDTSGEIEVRLNGATVLSLAGVDTRPDGYGLAAQGYIGTLDTTVTGWRGLMDIDDLTWRDANGSYFNTFIGDKKCYTLFPNADTATEDWTPSAGSDSFEMVNNNPPVAGEYLSAAAANDTTILGLENLPAEVVSVAGLVVMTRQWKSDAGSASTEVSIVSGATTGTSVERPLSQAPTFYIDVYETDPDTGIPWTVSGVNAAQFQIERTV